MKQLIHNNLNCWYMIGVPFKNDLGVTVLLDQDQNRLSCVAVVDQYYLDLTDIYADFLYREQINKSLPSYSWTGNMTVQMEMGIRRLHPLPVLCSKVEWASSLSDSEFPLASKMVDLNGMNGLKYTSLRDIMPCSPTSVGSPRREGNWCSCTTISIKNDLVKHAACAYLQPMITESHNDDDLFVCCLSMFTNDGFLFSCFKDYIWTPIDACIGFFTTRIFSNLSRTFGYLAGHLGGLFGVGVQKK